jgi:hypothetical protein
VAARPEPRAPLAEPGGGDPAGDDGALDLLVPTQAGPGVGGMSSDPDPRDEVGEAVERAAMDPTTRAWFDGDVR